MAVRELIDKLNCEKKLSHDEWVKLIKEYDEGDRAYAAELARGISQEMFGKDIYIRGIVDGTFLDCREFPEGDRKSVV